MKIISNYFILCEKVIKNDRGMISLLDLFDEINTDVVPVLHANFNIAINLTLQDLDLKKDKKVTFELTITSESKKEVLRAKLDRKLDKIKSQKIGILLNPPGILFPEFGNYKAVLKSKGKKISELQFQLNKNSK